MKMITVEPIHATTKLYVPIRTVLQAMLIAMAIFPVGCNKDEQQANQAPAPTVQPPSTQLAVPTQAVPQQPTPAAPAKPLNDLESLVAPIALYPDPLLAELLVASTYPLEVVQAARWLETRPDLTTLSSKDWDASVMRLASVPLVIKMMNDHLDWTTQLGDAFLAKPAEVMAVIQTLRKRAVDAGYLKDTPEQKVAAQTVSLKQATDATGAVVTPAVLKKEVITIKPAKSDTVYVPQYNPEVVYQAPMAPPPTSTVVNVNSGVPAPSYYPTYYPASATTTTSSNDSWASFATGAVVGGLLTWGIMEWTDDDDWDDYHHVSHYYGDSVCHNGNCWSGGGGYYGDRGNVNYNKNINISGNDINIDRGASFNQNNLRPAQQPAGWQPNPRHRRGQAYPESVQKRLGGNQQPALAGQRLGSAQTLPASARGFAEVGQRPTDGTLPSERRPSSADIQQQLAKQTGAQSKLAQNKATQDIQGKLGQVGARDNALQGLKTSGQASRLESQRGANSRRPTSPRTLESQARQPTGGLAQTESSGGGSMKSQKQPSAQNRFESPKPVNRSEALAGRERAQQQLATRHSLEAARPNAFEVPRNAGATQTFSQRGASSFQRSASAGNFRASGSGGVRGAGGGVGRRR